MSQEGNPEMSKDADDRTAATPGWNSMLAESPEPDRTTATAPRTPRWAGIRHYQVSVGDDVFIDRWRLLTVPALTVLVTRIFGPDSGRDPHDHARSFISLAVSGGYTEKVWDTRDMSRPPVTRHHRPWRPYLLRRSQAHTITQVSGKLRTIVLAGPHHGTFRFWTPEGPVDYKDYG